MTLVRSIEIKPGESWAQPSLVLSVDAAYRTMGHTCMAKWSSQECTWVFSLVNDNGAYCMAKKCIRASIKVVSQRNRTHNVTLSILRVLFLWLEVINYNGIKTPLYSFCRGFNVRTMGAFVKLPWVDPGLPQWVQIALTSFQELTWVSPQCPACGVGHLGLAPGAWRHYESGEWSFA